MRVVRGDDRAWGYLRLAEMHADLLHNPGEARKWCKRLLAEFPDSVHAPQTRALLDSLEHPPAQA